MITQFTLSRPAKPETISVFVNEVLVTQDATNGWTYDSSANSIRFHGTAVPPDEAQIRVTYEPTSVK
jgi:hypothetical protein